MTYNNNTTENSFHLNCYLDERLISSTCKGGLRDWLCQSYCMAEKVYWKEIICDQFYQRLDDRQTTLLLLQPKLGQLCDLIRSSEEPYKIGLCLEGRLFGKQVMMNKPHRSLYYSSRKLDLMEEQLRKLRDLIGGSTEHQISEVLMDIFEQNLNRDFPDLNKGKTIELLAAKIYFNHY